MFVNREASEWLLPAGVERVVCNVSGRSRARRYLFEQRDLPGELRATGVRLVHSLGYVAPLRAPCPSVVTIPDLNYRAFGSQMPLVRRLALAWFVRRAARRAARIITISDFARREIAAAFGIDRDEITVTHLAPLPRTAVADPEVGSRLAKLSIREPYLIAFSSPSPHKNIPALLHAFAMAREEHRLPHQLVLLGHLPPGLSVGSDGAGDDSVRVVGYLQNADLSAVMARAELLVFPSLYEGYGLPVLEAMSAGVPVVCSDRASLPEVAGDAAVFFDPTSIPEMSEAIARVAADRGLRDSLREKGFRNAARFSWDRTAAETLDVYRRVLGSEQ